MGAKRRASHEVEIPRDDGCTAGDEDEAMPGPEDLKRICDAFEAGVGTARRRRAHPLRHDRRAPVFSGFDAVSFLVDNGHAGSREVALGIGRRMAYERALLWHETKDFDFEDEKNLFYTFVPASERVISPLNPRYFSGNLLAIAEEFEEGMIESSNLYKKKTYKDTFVGKEAVTFLVSSRMAMTRQDAVRIGQLLMEKCDMFQPVSKKQKFKDKHLLYRFVPCEQRVEDHPVGFRAAVPTKEKALLFKEVVGPANPFPGSGAVDAMVDGGVAPSRSEAVVLGEKLISDVHLFRCVRRAKTFLDRPDTYYAYYEGHRAQSMDGMVVSGQSNDGGAAELGMADELEVVMGMKYWEGEQWAIDGEVSKNDEGGQIITTRIMHGMAFHVSEEISHLEDLVVLGGKSEGKTSDKNVEELPNEMMRTPPPRLFDRFGFILEEDEYDCDASAFSRDCNSTVKSTAKELSAQEWKVLLDRCTPTESGVSSSSINTVKRSMRIGLPDSMRRRAWTAITGVDAMVRKREGDYQAFVETATRLMEDEGEEQSLLRVIERDLHRTFPRHFLFYERGHSAGEGGGEELPPDGASHDGDPVERPPPDGLVSLRHVLYAYTIYDNEVGYCQGMNFIAGMFLTFLNEEESFWMLVAVMNEEPYGMRGLYTQDMSGFHETLYVAERVIQRFLPKLHRHLEREHVDLSMFVTQWILTMFTSTFHFDLVSRVWDSYIVEGWKVVYRVILSLLEHAQQDLLGLNLEHILFYLKDEFPSKVDGPSIFKASLKIPLRQRHVRKYTAEWRLARSGHRHMRRRLSINSGSATSADSNASSLSSVVVNGNHRAKKFLPGLLSK